MSEISAAAGKDGRSKAGTRAACTVGETDGISGTDTRAARPAEGTEGAFTFGTFTDGTFTLCMLFALLERAFVPLNTIFTWAQAG